MVTTLVFTFYLFIYLFICTLWLYLVLIFPRCDFYLVNNFMPWFFFASYFTSSWFFLVIFLSWVLSPRDSFYLIGENFVGENFRRGKVSSFLENDRKTVRGNFSSGKIFVTNEKCRHFSPTKFSPIRYPDFSLREFSRECYHMIFFTSW